MATQGSIGASTSRGRPCARGSETVRATTIAPTTEPREIETVSA